MTKTIAERCVLINVRGEEAKSVIPILDEFANENNLFINKGHPISPHYEKRNGDEIEAQIVYTMGIGRFGAELSLFRFDVNKNSDIVGEFDAFVNEKLKNKYASKTCPEEPNYKTPEAYR